MNNVFKYRVWDKKLSQFLSCPASINVFGRKQEDEDYIIQFWTGLKDKNGKEIYEGDLIKGDDYGPYCVWWENGAYCSCCYRDCDFIAGYETIEVMGNILETKEYEGKQWGAY